MTMQTRTLKQLAEDVQIRVWRREPTATEIRQGQEDRPRGSYERDPGTRYFTVALTYRGRTMRTPFHQGSAWTTDPTAAEVLECLLLDASGYENARGFEDWAGEYGYDTDSRRAERTYKQVQAQTERLKLLLGSEYRAFAEAEQS